MKSSRSGLFVWVLLAGICFLIPCHAVAQDDGPVRPAPTSFTLSTATGMASPEIAPQELYLIQSYLASNLAPANDMASQILVFSFADNTDAVCLPANQREYQCFLSRVDQSQVVTPSTSY